MLKFHIYVPNLYINQEVLLFFISIHIMLINFVCFHDLVNFINFLGILTFSDFHLLLTYFTSIINLIIFQYHLFFILIKN